MLWLSQHLCHIWVLSDSCTAFLPLAALSLFLEEAGYAVSGGGAVGPPWGLVMSRLELGRVWCWCSYTLRRLQGPLPSLPLSPLLPPGFPECSCSEGLCPVAAAAVMTVVLQKPGPCGRHEEEVRSDLIESQALSGPGLGTEICLSFLPPPPLAAASFSFSPDPCWLFGPLLGEVGGGWSGEESPSAAGPTSRTWAPSKFFPLEVRTHYGEESRPVVQRLDSPLLGQRGSILIRLSSQTWGRKGL